MEPFFQEDFEDDAVGKFVRALEERARGWTNLGVSHEDSYSELRDGAAVLGLDLTDQETGGVIHTLRLDFDGRKLTCGPDPTGQFVGALLPTQPDVQQFENEEGPQAFAMRAADWIEKELRRPIERAEWHRDFPHTRWYMADTKRGLCWRDSANQPRPELRGPDKVISVRHFR